MNNQTLGILISALLVGASSAIPDLPTEQPDFFADEPIATPPLPDEAPPVAEPVVSVDPTRAGMIREDTGTRIVGFSRPLGVADSCKLTTCNAPIGSRWLSLDERRYQKLADGTFQKLLTAQERAAGMVQETSNRDVVAEKAAANNVLAAMGLPFD